MQNGFSFASASLPLQFPYCLHVLLKGILIWSLTHQTRNKTYYYILQQKIPVANAFGDFFITICSIYNIEKATVNPAITIETIDISLIRILSEGPEVSLKGSPTVSPTTVALCATDPLPP